MTSIFSIFVVFRVLECINCVYLKMTYIIIITFLQSNEKYFNYDVVYLFFNNLLTCLFDVIFFVLKINNNASLQLMFHYIYSSYYLDLLLKCIHFIKCYYFRVHQKQMMIYLYYLLIIQ